jgi:serine/threonine protein phosphatase PrpC
MGGAEALEYSTLFEFNVKIIENAMFEIDYSSKSDIGLVRSTNEDCVGVRSPLDDGPGKRDRHLFVVADGMGGQEKGEEAAYTAVMVLLKKFIADEPKEDFTSWLVSAYSDANKQILDSAKEDPPDRHRGTTLTSLLVAGEMAYFAHVGDSRAYLLRSGKMKRLTTDHTVAQSAVSAGTMTEEQAANSPKRGYLTRAVGYRGKVEVDTFQGKIHAGDIFLLTTDGLTSEVPEQTLFEIAGKYNPERAGNLLIKMARDRGGRDNISIQVVKAAGPARRRWNRRLIYAGAAVILALILVLGGGFLGKKLHWFGKEKLHQPVVNVIDVDSITEAKDFREKCVSLQEKAEKLKLYVNTEDHKKINDITEQLTQLHNKTDEDNLDANKPTLQDLNQQLLAIQAKYIPGGEIPKVKKSGGKDEGEG